MNVHSVFSIEESSSFAEIERNRDVFKPKFIYLNININIIYLRIFSNRQVGVPEKTHIIQGCGSKGDEF